MKTLINTGRMVDPIAGIEKDKITIDSLAASLSKICRFNGHCNRFYSVAEHCYVSAMWAMDRYRDPEIALACLLHDAAESFIGDIVTPIKITLPDLNNVESKILSVIGEKYHVEIVSERGMMRPEVKEIDQLMLAVERNLFMPENDLWSMDMPMMPDRVRNHFFIGGQLIGETQWQEAEQQYKLMALQLLKEIGKFG